MYGEGISKSGELIDLGVAANLIEKSGSWYSYKTQRIGQGRENAKQFMMENPEMANEVEHALRQNAGLFETVMLESNPETANKDSNNASETLEPNDE
jgi:recombination protein RecA